MDDPADDDVLPFASWSTQLHTHVERLGKVYGRGGPLIDARLPWALGWSPQRAARALLNLDYKDHEHLAEITRGKPDVGSDNG